MLDFDIKMGFACNHNCIHCAAKNENQELNLTTQKLKDIIDSLDPKKWVVRFSGGEPTIRPDFLELIKYAREHRGRRVKIHTNATGFADEKLAAEAVKYMDGVLITIHSCDSNIHDKIAQTNGAWEKTIQGIKNLLKYRQTCSSQVRIETNTIISNWNKKFLLNTLEFIQALVPKTGMGLVYPHPVGNALKYAVAVLPKYSDIKEEIQQCIKRFGPYLMIRSIPKCQLFPYQENCRTDSWLKDLQRPGFNPIASKNGYIEDYTIIDSLQKKKAEECERCCFNSECTGVWEQYIDLYKKELDLFPIEN